MATPSLEGYKTTAAQVYGNNNIQQQWDDVPTYNMFGNTGASTQAQTTNNWSKDKEVELGLGKSVYGPMSDNEKQQYIDSLTDEQYRQMRTYKNQGYSFEASRTLLENSEGLANPTAVGTEKYNPKGNFFRNIVGGAGDSATGIGQFLGNTAADIIGRTAKKLGADEDRVDYLVNDRKNYLEDSKISKSVKANTNSGTYKVTKGLTDLAQTIGIEGAIKDALPGAAGKLGTLRGKGLGGKMAAGAIEGAADMGLYSIVSESELPTRKDLALGGGLGAAFPLAGAGLKAGKNLIKKEAGAGAERLIERITKVSPTKLQKFEDQFGESVGRFMNDRGLKTRQDASNYFINNLKKVDEALGSIQGTFKSPVVDDVLTESVEFATKTADENLNRLLELQQKAANEGLTMSEVNEVKRYFEGHTKFTYGKSQDAIKASKATNLDTRLRDWQMQMAKESGLDNLAQLNRETQASKYILNNAKDAGEGLLGPIDVTDELLAIHYGGLDRALSTYVTKSLLKSAKFQAKAVDILNRLAGHQNIEAILADLEKISKVNTEKEFEALMKKRELDQALPAPKAGGVNDAGYTILEQGENMVSGPNGNKVMDSVTEIGGGNTQGYVNSSQAVRPQAEVSTPKAQTKVVEQTKAVEQTPKVSETVVNSEKPNLREIFGDKYYKQLEEQVELINRTRVGAKNGLTGEPLNLKPITVEDLDLSSDLYKRDFENYWYKEMEEIQKEYSKINTKYPPAKITDAMQKQLDKAKTQAEKDKLLEKWRNEYIEKNPLSDEDLAKVEELINRSNEINERFKKIQDYLYGL